MTYIRVTFPWDTMATCLAFTKVVEGRLRLSKRDLLKNGAYTPTKFNVATEKWWLEDYFPIGQVTFQGLCYTSGGYQKKSRLNYVIFPNLKTFKL